MILTERGRADAVQSLWIGWMVSRFAVEREQTLRSPGHYIKAMFESEGADTSFEQQEAEFHRMAAAWGLEVVDLPMEGDEG